MYANNRYICTGAFIEMHMLIFLFVKRKCFYSWIWPPQSVAHFNFDFVTFCQVTFLNFSMHMNVYCLVLSPGFITNIFFVCLFILVKLPIELINHLLKYNTTTSWYTTQYRTDYNNTDHKWTPSLQAPPQAST